MKLIYLDWNIYVGLMNDQFQGLLELLQKFKEMGYIIAYSAEIIKEARNIRDQNEIAERLKFIGELTDNTYFENSAVDHQLIKRSPFDVRDTLAETGFLPSVKAIYKVVGRVLSYRLFKLSRKMLKIDESHLNNLDPASAVNYIEDRIRNSKHTKKLPTNFHASPLRFILDETVKNQSNPLSYILVGASPYRGHAPDMKVNVLYELLEIFGYWSDSKKVFDKGSRIYDRGHCYYAMLSEVTLSNDKKFRAKTSAIAQLVGSEVDVKSPSQFLEQVG